MEANLYLIFAQVLIVCFVAYFIYSLRLILRSFQGISGGHIRRVLKSVVVLYIPATIYIAWSILLANGLIDLSNNWLLIASNFLLVLFAGAFLYFLYRIRRFARAFSF